MQTVGSPRMTKGKKDIKSIQKIEQEKAENKIDILHQSKHHHSILSHLSYYKQVTSTNLKKENILHYSLIELCLKLSNGMIRGSNTKCTFILEGMKKIISDYHALPSDIIPRDLNHKFTEIQEFLKKFTVLNEGVVTAFRVLKFFLTKLKHDTTEEEVKEYLLKNIDFFLAEKIKKAKNAIIQQGLDLIQSDDIIITFGYSSVILELFKAAHNAKKKFKIIVVDNHPFNEGSLMIQELSKEKINCTYTLLGAVPKFLPKINKIFVGASSILINGYCLSRVGTAMLACLANYYKKPFIIFCETYKLSTRSQLDSFSTNEVLSPKKMLTNKEKDEGFVIINLRWDLTPIKFINMVVTEWGKFPPTSIPVLLRELEKMNYVGAPKK